MNFRSLFLAGVMGLTLGACKTIDDDPWDNQAYRFRAVPGPTDWETDYTFARGGLAIRASGETEDAIPIVHFVIQNHGGTRISLSEGMFTFRGGEPSRTLHAELRNNLDTRVSKLTLLARDECKFSVRSLAAIISVDGSLILEVRGVRDDAGDGGYDFDLFAEPVPEELEGARGTRQPKPEENTGRREIRDTNSIETPTKTKP